MRLTGCLPVQRLARHVATALSLAMLIGLAATPAHAIDGRLKDAGFIPIRGAAPAPAGAHALCQTYDWACARSGRTITIDDSVLQVVHAVNLRANRNIRPISDVAQYRVAERWALPTARGGDCEDYALFKKRELVRAGIPPDQLFVATVLDRKRQSHAVLVLRTGSQDLVLDNLTDRILPWKRTGYTFLRLQDPGQPTGWVSVLAGGLMAGS